MSLSTAIAQAAPVGGQVVSGAGGISQSGSTTTVQQSSQNLSLTWQSFNTTSSETVNFVQPNAAAIAVNRILDVNGTKFYGHLNANGQVYLINPNGILFGHGAQVNVGGLVASTLELKDASLGGTTKTFSGAGTGSVINQGKITAANGGYVALLANHVSNQGAIIAKLGTVALAAGSAATLTFRGNSLISLQIDQSVLNSLAENGGLLRADGGLVVMTAGARDSLLASVVNNTGVIEARTVDNTNGTITLLGGMQAGTVNVDGTLNASAPDGGNGGFIETSAAHVKVADSARISTAAAKGATGTWLIDPTDFTIASGSGTQTESSIGADTLTGLLVDNNIKIATSAATSGNGDIFVNSAVSWSANKLTLSAHRNININANLNGSGTASLALEYGQSALASGNTSTYTLGNGAKVYLPAGQNFSTKLGSDGATTNYTVITSLGAEGSTTATDLQGINGDRAGNYVLGGDIDASATSIWNSGSGFDPIGAYSYRFTGRFDGLGHTISNLNIIRPSTDFVGLFGYVDTGASVSNVGLVNAYVWGHDYVGALAGISLGSIANSYVDSTHSVIGNGFSNFGGLVGQNSGTISNSYANIDVSAVNMNDSANVGGLVGSNSGTITQSHAAGNVSGNSNTGGLVGLNSGTISNSYVSAGAVTGGNHGDATANFGTTLGANIGGLVGSNVGGLIDSSYAASNVSGNSAIGGLVGSSNGTISNSHATGTVTGIDFGVTDGWAGDGVGGLVGYNSGAISNSYATGNVTSTSDSVHCFNLGGLVGSNFTSGSSISNSYATGSVTGSVHTENNSSSQIGGLAGENKGTITNSYVVGSVSGNKDVGGLAGNNTSTGTITNSYAVGSVSGNDDVGGLVGINNGSTNTSYATGLVTGITNAGALIGLNWGSVSGSYWNSSINSTLSGIGGGSIVATTGLSTEQLQQQSNLSSFDFNTVWIGYDGHTNPLLRSFMKTLTVTASNASKTYDGLAYTGGNGVTYSVTPDGNLLGTVSYGGTSQNAVNANDYTITASGLYSNQQGYIINYVDGTLTVNKRALTGSITTGSSTYGSALSFGTVSFGNLVEGDDITATVTVDTTGHLSTSNHLNAGSYTGIESISGLSGADAGNYTFDNIHGDYTVAQKALTVASIATTGSTYGGTVTTGAVTFTNGDVVTNDVVTSTASIVSPTNSTSGHLNAGSYKQTATAISGADAGNYALTSFTTAANNYTVAQKALTVASIATAGSTYGGTVTTGAVTFTNGDVVTNDVVTSTASIVSPTNSTSGHLNAGSYKQTATAISGADAGNYALTSFTTAANNYTVDKLAISVSGITVNDKVYDSTTNATLNVTNAQFGGTVSGDHLQVDSDKIGGSFVTANVGNNVAVNLTGVTLSGTDAANYTVNGGAVAAVSGKITVANLYINAVTDSKVFDGTTASKGTVAVSGLLGTDKVDAVQSFASANSLGQNGSTLSVTGYTVNDGNNGNNYVVSSSTATGTILPLVLVGESFSFPTTQAQSLASGLPVSIQAMSQSRSESREVASLLSANGPSVTVLNGGVRMPDDRMDR